MIKKGRLSGHLLFGLGVFMIGIVSVLAYCFDDNRNNNNEYSNQQYCQGSNCSYYNQNNDSNVENSNQNYDCGCNNSHRR